MNKKNTKFIKITNISLLFREKKRNICNFNKFGVFFYSYIYIYIYIYISYSDWFIQFSDGSDDSDEKTEMKKLNV